MSLPKVSAFKINKELSNSQVRFYGKNENEKKKVNVVKKINDIFKANNHVYKSKVKITLKDQEIEETIIGKTSTNLLTIKGKSIRIIDIIDIERL